MSNNTKTPPKIMIKYSDADRRRTVRWSNYSPLTGVANRFTGPTGGKVPNTNMRDEMARKLSVLCRSQKEE